MSGAKYHSSMEDNGMPFQQWARNRLSGDRLTPLSTRRRSLGAFDSHDYIIHRFTGKFVDQPNESRFQGFRKQNEEARQRFDRSCTKAPVFAFLILFVLWAAAAGTLAWAWHRAGIPDGHGSSFWTFYVATIAFVGLFGLGGLFVWQWNLLPITWRLLYACSFHAISLILLAATCRVAIGAVENEGLMVTIISCLLTLMHWLLAVFQTLMVVLALPLSACTSLLLSIASILASCTLVFLCGDLDILWPLLGVLTSLLPLLAYGLVLMRETIVRKLFALEDRALRRNCAGMFTPKQGGTFFFSQMDTGTLPDTEMEVVPRPDIPWRIEISSLVKEERLGAGAFGVLFKATYNGHPVTVKFLHSVPSTPSSLRILINSLRLLMRLSHPHICAVYSVALDVTTSQLPSTVGVVMEYLSGGNLQTFLSTKGHSITWQSAVTMMYEIALGMQYLHSCDPPIVHRDLNSSNIMLDDKGRMKIADLGLAKIIGTADLEDHKANRSGLFGRKRSTPGSFGSFHTPVDRGVSPARRSPGTSSWAPTYNSYNDTSGGSMSGQPAGAPQWMAPELFEDLDYDEKVDVFSFGIVMWEIITGKMPFEGMLPYALPMAITGGTRPPIDSNVPRPLALLMQRCWADQPEDRPSFSEVLLELTHLRGVLAGMELLSKPVHNTRPSTPPSPQAFTLPSSVPQIAASELTLVQRIGGGGFSEVYEGRYRSTRVAVKMFDFSIIGQVHNRLNIFRQEALIISSLRHPNVVMFLGAVIAPEFFAIVTNHMERGNLNNLLRAHRHLLGRQVRKVTKRETHRRLPVAEEHPFGVDRKEDGVAAVAVVEHQPLGFSNTQVVDTQFTELYKGPLTQARAIQTAMSLRTLTSSHGFLSLPVRIRIALDVSRGMTYLHSSIPPLTHRDLKPENILIGANLEAVVGDLGFTKAKDSIGYISRCGTLKYTAPEILQQQPYEESVDVYSFGIILSELLTTRRPYWHLRDPLKSAKEPVFLGHVRDKKAKRPSADEKAFLASRVVRGERPLLFFPQELLSPHEARGRNYLYGYRIQPVGELLSRSSIPKEEDHTAITVHNDGGSPATGAPSDSMVSHGWKAAALAHLAKLCWDQNPFNRPTFPQIMTVLEGLNEVLPPHAQESDTPQEWVDVVIAESEEARVVRQEHLRSDTQDSLEGVVVKGKSFSRLKDLARSEPVPSKGGPQLAFSPPRAGSVEEGPGGTLSGSTTNPSQADTADTKAEEVAASSAAAAPLPEMEPDKQDVETPGAPATDAAAADSPMPSPSYRRGALAKAKLLKIATPAPSLEQKMVGPMTPSPKRARLVVKRAALDAVHAALYSFASILQQHTHKVFSREEHGFTEHPLTAEHADGGRSLDEAHRVGLDSFRSHLAKSKIPKSYNVRLFALCMLLTAQQIVRTSKYKTTLFAALLRQLIPISWPESSLERAKELIGRWSGTLMINAQVRFTFSLKDYMKVFGAMQQAADGRSNLFQLPTQPEIQTLVNHARELQNSVLAATRREKR